jgi:hypothetical protein
MNRIFRWTLLALPLALFAMTPGPAEAHGPGSGYRYGQGNGYGNGYGYGRTQPRADHGWRSRGDFRHYRSGPPYGVTVYRNWYPTRDWSAPRHYGWGSGANHQHDRHCRH